MIHSATRNQWLLIPNIIGIVFIILDYFRGFILIIAVIFYTHGYIYSFITNYILSQLLDMVDGYLARKLNQGNPELRPYRI